MAVNICFQGNVGGEPQTRTFNNVSSVTTFSVAVSQGYFDQSHQWVDNGTMWIDVECAPGAAKQLPFVHKGVRVIVNGLLSQRFWTDKQGAERSTLRCYAQALGFINKTQQQGQPAPAPQTAAHGDPWEADSNGDYAF